MKFSFFGLALLINYFSPCPHLSRALAAFGGQPEGLTLDKCFMARAYIIFRQG